MRKKIESIKYENDARFVKYKGEREFSIQKFVHMHMNGIFKLRVTYTTERYNMSFFEIKIG